MFNQRISKLKKNNLYRTRKIINNNQIINFCSNDYLALANHPLIKKAFKDGVNNYGVGSTSSHLISGHSVAHSQLEEELAAYTKQQKALLFSTGYMANLGIFSALKNDLNWVLQDRLNHASLLDANSLINLPIRRYLHNNMNSLQQKIIKLKNFGMVATDNIFSMDGDNANIVAINNIINNNNAILLQDDAHGFGIFDPTIPNNSIYMATFGKAAGTMGAFVAGSNDFINYLIQKSRPYIYTTAIPSAICVATLKALELIKLGKQKEKLFNNIKLFKSLINTNSNSAIQPIIIGSSAKALKISNYLFDNGFYVAAIRPPTVANNSARLRITLNASHSKQQIINLIEVLNAKL